MRRIFTEPNKPEELYEFFTYGLSLHSMNWRHIWWDKAILNHIKRRLWCIRIARHSESIAIEYQPGVKESDKSWYMYERKYVV